MWPDSVVSFAKPSNSQNTSDCGLYASRGYPALPAELSGSVTLAPSSRYTWRLRAVQEGKMAARPTWRGHLKVSLVTVPIRVFPATDSASSVSFNQLHGECQTRIQQKKWCPHCDRQVDKSEIVKGYEFQKGHYVVVDEEDIAKARPESTRVINLLRFADVESIDPIYVDRPYYLAPDGTVAAEAFGVLREALRGKAGIGKLALYGREYVVAVQPRERGLMMFTLRQADEIRKM